MNGGGYVTYREWSAGRSEDRHGLRNQMQGTIGEVSAKVTDVDHKLDAMATRLDRIEGGLAVFRWFGFGGLVTLVSGIIYVVLRG